MELSREYIYSIKSSQKKGRYDAAQIDGFLNTIADGIEKKNADLEALQAELRKYKEMEAALAAALISAQRSSDTLIEEAKRQAAALLSDAKKSAEDSRLAVCREEETIREGYKKDCAELAAEIAALKSFKDEFSAALRRDVDIFSDRLSDLIADKVWEDRPPEADKQTDVSDSYSNFDINEILKNLPESDKDLKAMIDELI